MSEKAAFIRIPTPPNGRSQTMPTEPSRRIPKDDIKLALCDENDFEKIAEGFYAAYPDEAWDVFEPPAQRPPEYATRQTRFANRLRASLSVPHQYWVKAVYVPTNEIIGAAGWSGPGVPVHNVMRRTAVDFYGFKEKFKWTDDEIEEMWRGVDIDVWEEKLGGNDVLREEVMKDEGHWFLAPLMTWPDWQGRGVGKLLIDWAIKQADATDPVTPLYLESAKTARAVYMHLGFVPVGKDNFVRRGPAVVSGLEALDEVQKEGGDGSAKDIVVTEKGDVAVVDT